jgi:hypothetical protein
MGVKVWGLLLFGTFFGFIFQTKAYGFVDVSVQRALSAQAKGAIASGLTRREQDLMILEYAESYLRGETTIQDPAKLAGLPAPLADIPGGVPFSHLSFTGLVASALNIGDFLQFATNLVAEGRVDLFGLQAPIEYVLEIVFRHYLGKIPGMGLTLSQFRYSTVSKLIIQFYLSSLLAGTEKSDPVAFARVKQLQYEMMTDQFIKLGRQMSAIYRGIASRPMRIELLKAIVRSAPAAVRAVELHELSLRLARKYPRLNSLLASEVAETLRDLNSPLLEDSDPGGTGVVVLFVLIKFFQHTFAIPVDVLHFANGISRNIASIDSVPPIKIAASIAAQVTDIPANVVNDAVMTAYFAVGQFEKRLKRDLETRYPYEGPSLSEILKSFFYQGWTRYQTDLAKRELRSDGKSLSGELFLGDGIPVGCENLILSQAG